MILTLTNFFVGFLNYLFNSLSAKLLGPKGYGEITTIFSYMIVLSVPISVFTTDIIRRLGEKGEAKIDAWVSWRNWFWGKINKYKWLIIPYFLLTFLFSRFTNLSTFSSFIVIEGLFISLISVFYTAAFQGLHLFLLLSIFSITATIIKLSGPILVYFRIDGLNTILTCLILAGVIPFIAGDILFRKRFQAKKTNYQIKKTASQIIFNPVFFITLLSLVSIGLLNNFDVMFVKKFFPQDTVGLYGAWSLLAKIILYVCGSLTAITYIFFSDKQEDKNHKKILFLTIIAIIFTGAILYGSYYYYSRTIVFLFFNDKYLSIVSLLPKAAIFGIFFTIISIINSFFLAKKSRLALIVTIFIPFYALGLLTFGKTINAIIDINLIFSGVITVAYLIGAYKFNS